MSKKPKSLLQRTLRTARILKTFSLEDLEISLKNAKRNTLLRYISAMISNGNIIRLQENSYKFLSNKEITTRIGGAESVIKQIKKSEEFFINEIQKNSNANSKVVRQVLEQYVKLGILSRSRVKGYHYYKMIDKK